jgi:cation diffusion facilitator CzcD-associated flavoprotein CzcO
METASDVLIIGAGAAGLATAACLKHYGIDALVLEAGDAPAQSWAAGYDALKLHTIRRYSGLPRYPMPRTYPLYASRDQVVSYLQDYARHFDIVPRTGQRVQTAQQTDDGWLVTTASDTFRSKILVAASGIFAAPVEPHWPGMETFRGSIQHTSSYKNAAPFAGKRVLIIGAGNSGAEIAVDVMKRAASTTVAIRNGVNVVPLSLLGVPIQLWGLLVLRLPPAVTRVVAKVLLKRAEARLQSAGIPKSPEPLLQAHGIPIIGLSFINAVREERIQVKPAVTSFGEQEVTFADGTRQPFDAVLLATGFQPALGYLDGLISFDERGFPKRDRVRSLDHPNLYFVGYNYGIAGTLNNIRQEAPIAAAQIAAQLGKISGAGKPVLAQTH